MGFTEDNYSNPKFNRLIGRNIIEKYLHFMGYLFCFKGINKYDTSCYRIKTKVNLIW